MKRILVIERIEVIQSIQKPDNSVDLYSGKDTFVRVFLSQMENNKTPLRLQGELTVSTNEKTLSIKTTQHVTAPIPQEANTLHERLNWNSSLNFKVTDKQIDKPGNIRFSLTELYDVESGEQLKIEYAKNHPLELKFRSSELSVRVLAIRYRDIESREFLEPNDTEIEAVRRKLNAMFPIKKLSLENSNWSSVRIEAKDEFRALNNVPEWNRENDAVAARILSQMLVQVLLHREYEITHCERDERTIYIALIVDPSHRFGGVAMDSPRFPTPHMVGIASTDGDGSLAAHEIAHLLGCQHPGIPKAILHGDHIGQHGEMDADQQNQMHKLGFVSKDLTSTSACIGLDSSKDSQQPELLSPDRYFDLMTYLYPQWLSDYHYGRIAMRIHNLNQKTDFLAKPDEKCWTVICLYELDKKAGEIIAVVASKFVTPRPSIVEGEFAKSIFPDISRLETSPSKILDQTLQKQQFTKFVLLNALVESTDTDERNRYWDELNKIVNDADKANKSTDEKFGITATLDYSFGHNGKAADTHRDKVYFRSIGNENHHPFGILQHTIVIQDENTELKQVWFKLDEFHADTVILPTEVVGNGTASHIEASLKLNKNPQPKANRHISDISLQYRPRKDIYKLRIKYSSELLKTAAHVAQVTTTILAKRPDSDIWEVISVRDGLEQSFWVSREFITPNLQLSQQREPESPADAALLMERFVKNQLDRPVYLRDKDKISIRVLIRVGSVSPELSGEGVGINVTDTNFDLEVGDIKPARRTPVKVDASTLKELNPDLYDVPRIDSHNLKNEKNPQNEERFFVKLIPHNSS